MCKRHHKWVNICRLSIYLMIRKLSQENGYLHNMHKVLPIKYFLRITPLIREAVTNEINMSVAREDNTQINNQPIRCNYLRLALSTTLKQTWLTRKSTILVISSRLIPQKPRDHWIHSSEPRQKTPKYQ